MKIIKWGIIGAGRISAIFATALNATEGAELAAIASRNMQRSRVFAKEYGVKTAYGAYEDIATDDTIDIIYIGTTHTEHLKCAELCIQAGKNVLCEKPFTLNSKDTTYLVDLARKNHVFLMEAMWTRFLPATKMIKEWIKAGRIGKIKYINIRFGFYSEMNVEDRLFNPETGGGALLDVGIYPVSYALYMTEQHPKSIKSSAHIGFTGVDEVNTMLLEFEDGIIADLSSSITVDVGKDATIVGDKGKINVKNFWSAQSAELYDTEGNLLEVCEEPFLINGYEYEIMEADQCLREGRLESNIMPLDATKANMHVLDMIRGQWNLVYPQEY